MYVTSIVFLKVGMLGKSKEDSETGGLSKFETEHKRQKPYELDRILGSEVSISEGNWLLGHRRATTTHITK
jgi:hypothetical protein